MTTDSVAIASVGDGSHCVGSTDRPAQPGPAPRRSLSREAQDRTLPHLPGRGRAGRRRPGRRGPGRRASPSPPAGRPAPPDRGTAPRPVVPGPGGPSPRSGRWPVSRPPPIHPPDPAPPAPRPPRRRIAAPGTTHTGAAAAGTGPAELHDRLVPRPRPAGRHQRIGLRLGLGGIERAPRPPGQHPPDVGVDHPDVALERERQHRGPCRDRRRAAPAGRPGPAAEPRRGRRPPPGRSRAG